jgi:hypothetical protein
MCANEESFWDAVIRDIDELARLELAIRRRVDEVNIEDLKQVVAFTIFRRIRDPDLLRRLASRDTRRAFISTCLRLSALEWARQKQRRAMDSIEGVGDSLRAEAADDDLLLDLKLTVPRDSKADYAVKIILKRLTLPEYAQKAGVTERTARRHLFEGIGQLAHLLRDYRPQ